MTVFDGDDEESFEAYYDVIHQDDCRIQYEMSDLIASIEKSEA